LAITSGLIKSEAVLDYDYSCCWRFYVF